ncbi:YlbF family regulator [Lederbergia sp. NSJ-179]|uniref:YlbF family regulator n=1 Tax=Lederbergia sp. NSJ-179 TaxID=2931402 RepID=UPI001FD417A2|nr:YlbF family regulator [Lederbergia sp. NSJ-179]MCJ7840431.1 YlbF family regulator [Lederbergia sp. NSJ-179]
MATNLYDCAYELEKALRQSDEFTDLRNMYKAVEDDATAKSMFDSFRQIQMQLQEKQMAGQDISEEEVQQAQMIANQVQQNEKVTKLMEAEQQMSMMIQELNKIIIKPLDDLYGVLGVQ